MAPLHAFDPHMFLAKIGAGRTLVACPKQRPIFTQGEAADAVFYIQEGQVKLTVVSEHGKEAVSFFPNKFRKLGFIDYNGGLRVHSALLNVVLYD